MDILINNAGIIYAKAYTKDGHDMVFGTNHLGPFLLTNLLLDILKASAPSRIINVSSKGHALTSLKRDDLMGEKSYSLFSAYAQSKLANVLFTRQLSKRIRNTGVTANSLHPGAVRTEISRNAPLWWYIFYPLVILFKTAKAGAQTTIAVALDPDLEQVSGKYFDECIVTEESKDAQNDDDAEWLWNVSEQLTELVK